MKLLGPETPQDYINRMNADQKPWYLRSNYDQAEILIDPDGSVRAGTGSALVERLTAHELGRMFFFYLSQHIGAPLTVSIDTAFNKNFLMTFKSFMTVDELFDHLAKRFWIQPPPGLKPQELEEWTRLKQQIVRVR